MKNIFLKDDYIKKFDDIEQKLFEEKHNDVNYIVLHKRKRKFFIHEINDYIEINRRSYLNKTTNTIEYPLDSYLGYEDKSPYNVEQKSEIITLFFDYKMSYKQIKYLFKINDHSLSNILNSISYATNENELQIKNKIVLNNSYLNVHIDDSFLPLKSYKNYTKKYKIRILNFYTNYKNDIFYNQLFVVIIFKTNTTSIKKSLDVINKIIGRYYKVDVFNSNKFEIIVAGDGARFIKTISNKLLAKIILDKWHCYQQIYRCFLHKIFKNASNKTKAKAKIKKKFYNELIKMINGIYNREMLTDFFKKVKEKFKKNKITFNYLKFKKLSNYLINNKLGIDSWKEKWYSGCFTETYVREFVKQFSATYDRVLSKKRFINLLKRECIVVDFS